jgi:hypothetical protein
MSNLKHYIAAYEATIYTGEMSDIEYEERGFVPCDNYVDAMHQIEQFYGEDIIDIKITLFDGPMLVTPKNIYERIIEEMK